MMEDNTRERILDKLDSIVEATELAMKENVEFHVNKAVAEGKYIEEYMDEDEDRVVEAIELQSRFIMAQEIYEVIQKGDY